MLGSSGAIGVLQITEVVDSGARGETQHTAVVSSTVSGLGSERHACRGRGVALASVSCETTNQGSMATLCAQLEKWLYKDDLAELHKAIYGNMGGSMAKKELVEAVTKGNPRKVLQKVGVGDMREYYRNELGRDPPAKAQMVK